MSCEIQRQLRAARQPVAPSRQGQRSQQLQELYEKGRGLCPPGIITQTPDAPLLTI